MRWFGEKWDASICNEERVDVPVGSPCGGCQNPIKENDQGLMVTQIIRWEGDNAICREVPHHRNCFVAKLSYEASKLFDKMFPSKKEKKK